MHFIVESCKHNYAESSFNSTFTNNSAVCYGGVMCTSHEYKFGFNITSTTFSATIGGVVRASGKSSITASKSDFIYNCATLLGSVLVSNVIAPSDALQYYQ